MHYKNHEIRIQKLVGLLRDEDFPGIQLFLDAYKGSFAAKYLLLALLQEGHGQTVPAVANALRSEINK